MNVARLEDPDKREDMVYPPGKSRHMCPSAMDFENEFG
jgi:hypothetical protein